MPDERVGFGQTGCRPRSGRLFPVKTDNDTSDIRDLAGCDMVLVNTCVVRQHAEDRAAGFITSLSGLKEKNPNIIIGVCGCLVPEPERDLTKAFPHVDLFIPPNQPKKLAEFLSFHSPFPVAHSPFVTIMHGCNNYCAYCVVPYVRGRETSRPMAEVLAEIKELWNWGTRDITLLGQNVNSYKYGLAELLKAIGPLVLSSSVLSSSIPSFRISFMTSTSQRHER